MSDNHNLQYQIDNDFVPSWSCVKFYWRERQSKNTKNLSDLIKMN